MGKKVKNAFDYILLSSFAIGVVFHLNGKVKSNKAEDELPVIKTEQVKNVATPDSLKIDSVYVVNKINQKTK